VRLSGKDPKVLQEEKPMAGSRVAERNPRHADRLRERSLEAETESFKIARPF
jgi:hypothetical protein